MKLTKAISVAIGLLFIVLSATAQTQLNAPVRWSTRNLLNCYDQAVDMKVIGGNDVALGVAGTKIFLWEYTTSDPSVTVNPVYQQFAQSPTDSVFFLPYLSFPRGQASQINTQQFRYIRAKLAQVHPVTGAILNIAAISNPTPVKFSPTSPKSNTPEVLNTSASCTNIPTGIIHMDITKYTDTVMYIVRYGNNNYAFCNPETGNPPCFNVVKSGRTTSSNFDITGIPAGNFTVLLANTGAEAGACYESYNATVPAQIPIKVDTHFVQHPPCYGDSLGSIRLLVSGGDRNTFHFSISPVQASAVFTFAANEAKWNNLKAGSYTTTFTDTCGLTITKNFTIVQPPKVTGTVLITVPTCASPGNGIIKVKAKYNFTSPGFTLYNYRVFKNGNPFDSLLNTSDTLFTKTGLQTATYQVTVTSPNLPNCPGINETFLLPFTPLTAATDSVKPVNCNGGSDGYIRLKAGGGSGFYRYVLRNNSTGFTATDTAGTFINLAAGSYTGRITNKTIPCTDSATVTINIIQPDTIATTVTKTDVQCKGMDNGTLSAIAIGGNTAGNYQYNWQTKVNGNWTGYFQTGSSITGVASGIYRSAIRDIKNCTGYSAAVTILEPDSLRIDSIKVQDIPCFAGSGHITLYASGGNGGYVQQYRVLTTPPGLTWTDFTPATGLMAGQYLVRLLDAKGCMATKPDTLNITSPPNTLDYTYSQVFYNGYNITCFGADNGIITINATGGNGGAYSGYQYRYDNKPWQPGNTLQNLPGGIRNIQVRDARGCVVARPVLFVEPTDSLQTALLTKTDITCYGAATGSISIKATGGVRPYRYNVNGGVFQTDSTFNNLPAGNHTIAVKDLNSCTGYITVTLVHINTDITMASTITNVSCKNGNDGSISTTISGGVGVTPYSYLWTPGNSTASSISNLTAGTYTLKVTDNTGCIKTFPIAVTEPAALAPIVTARQVCYGLTTGSILVQPVGGTAPFKYSKDNGVSFGTDSVFSNLAAGAYQIVVKDAKNCLFATTATVTVVSSNPNLNFIISSNQHAQDTLTMKEISWVKPDSVLWQYHPSATIIDPNRNEPKIKFLNPDTSNAYWVRLIGYYPNCTYNTQKYLRIYPFDPNAIITPADYNRGIKKAELFPNPNNGQFTLNVEFYKLQRVTVYITDITGFIVVPAQAFAPTLQLTKNYLSEMNGKAPGTYFLRIVSDYDSRNLLFVKQ